MVEIYEFSDDGAWCWFQDPRAIFIRGIFTKTYAQWMTRKGKLQCGSFNHETKEIKTFTLKKNWDRDDHNVGSFLILPDNRIMAFYARHDKPGLYSRTTVNPEDISLWEEEVTVCKQRKVTYSHPVYLRSEELFFVFWRGESWKPTYSTSKDGKMWNSPQVLIQDEGRSKRSIRPYTKIYSNGKRIIHLIFTDGHPRNESQNSIYYLQYKNGKFRKLNGDVMEVTTNNPIPHSNCDKLYDGSLTNVRAWIWDIMTDDKDHPYVLYTRLPSKTDHRYHFTRWDGHQWLDQELVKAGRWFPQSIISKFELEPHYSGGMVFNQQNPNIIYLSRQIKSNFEIEKWETKNLGHTWISTQLTADSKNMNVRPVFPRGYDQNTDHILWMHGKYRYFKFFYNTKINLLKG
ncbi:BNR-4 repeat-containing protein [Candidatus Lokiarchaeum ossiferum]|uniref:BNR-4 repeat-containing protein n=1 Tax=Candidatus Lokiarchaeum ossiferum TaxID=2951803 RepID=UPI00352CB7B3